MKFPFRMRSYLLVTVCILLLYITQLGLYRVYKVRSVENEQHVTIVEEKPKPGPSSTQPSIQSTPPLSTETLPLAYQHVDPVLDDMCQQRYGLHYLLKTAQTNFQYCDAAASLSNLTCFQALTLNSKNNIMCVVDTGAFPSDQSHFIVPCHLKNSSVDTNGFPSFGTFPEYWYSTGPGHIFHNHIKLHQSDHDSTKPGISNDCDSPSSHTILIKREGPFNLWHCLMEIMSHTFTMDILQLRGLFNPTSHSDTSQVIILDDAEDGPFFDLWRLVAKKPTRRLSEIKNSTDQCFTNLIVPLAGATNPVWGGDWTSLNCKQSLLINVFVKRVLEFYNITEQRDAASDLVVTFIDRQGSRHLNGTENLLERLSADLNKSITLQKVDFAAISFVEQLRIVRNTDILVGVHGAGLTHTMFLTPGSAVVEILPKELQYRGFRNLAKMRGNGYYSIHGSRYENENKDWQSEEVLLESGKFLDVVEAAVRSMYHRGILNIDVN